MTALRLIALASVSPFLAAAQVMQPPQPAAGQAAPPTIRPQEATLDKTLEIGGESVRAVEIDTRMAVDVKVDGNGPYRFVVDSGADRSVIGEALAARLALPDGPMVMLHGMAGSSRRATAHIARLGLGSSVVEDIAAPVLPERHIGADGLVGIDALRGQRLRLDFEHGVIGIEDARTPVRSNADEIVVTARRRGGQLILTQARASGVGVKAVIDTGSQLTVGNLALRDALFRRGRLPQPQQVTIISVTGEAIQAPLVFVPEMRIGGIVLRNAPIAFADLAPFRLFGLGDQPAMMLGTDLMGSFRRVSLDFGAKKVRFQLYRCRATTTRSGISLRADGSPASDCAAPSR